jgi:hypothetical protein
VRTARRLVEESPRLRTFGAALPLVIAAGLIPLDWVAGLPMLCPFRMVTGLPCPGCGMTRSLISLAHGDIAASLYFHPLGPALAIVAALAGAGRLEPFDATARVVIRHFTSSTRVENEPLVWVGLGATFAVWLVRLPLFLTGHWSL